MSSPPSRVTASATTPGELALVEAVGVAGDEVEDLGELGVDDAFAEAFGRAVVAQVEAATVGREGELLGEVHAAVAAFVLGEDGGDVRAHEPARAGERDRGSHEVVPRQAPVGGVGVGERAQGAGHEHRRGAGLVDEIAHDETESVAGLAEHAVGPQVRGRGAGHAPEPVVHDRLGVGRGEMQEGEAAEPAHERVDDALHEGRGDRRVEGVAAGPQHGGADVDRLRLGRDDHRGRFGQGALRSSHAGQATETTGRRRPAPVSRRQGYG